jgi:hypothetical protein
MSREALTDAAARLLVFIVVIPAPIATPVKIILREIIFVLFWLFRKSCRHSR